MCRPSCWSNFLSFSKNVGKERKLLKILKSELRWYLHARACLLLACLLACTQQLLDSNCESCWWVQVPLYASGKDTRIIWAHMGNIQGESVHRVTSWFPHVFSKIPSPSPPNPPAVLERLFVHCLRSQEMCARSQEMGVRSPQEMWMSRSQDMCARFQEIGCEEVSPKKCVWLGPKKCVQGLKKCERS
jgi:hypothetical protein